MRKILDEVEKKLNNDTIESIFKGVLQLISKLSCQQVQQCLQYAMCNNYTCSACIYFEHLGSVLNLCPPSFSYTSGRL